MPITPKRSEIADLLTNALAQATGLRPEQIDYVHADGNQIRITYSGPEPGLGGGSGRHAIRIYDTQTGALIREQLITDHAADDTVDLVGHLRTAVNAARERRQTEAQRP